MNEDKRKSIRLVMRKEDIMTFVSGLHELQLEMIDEAVERSDLRQAQEILKSIAENAK